MCLLRLVPGNNKASRSLLKDVVLVDVVFLLEYPYKVLI